MTWWCCYCGDSHRPDTDHVVVQEPEHPPKDMGGHTQLDPRYALAYCHGVLRPVVQDREAAMAAARDTGLLRPKHRKATKERKRRARL